MIKRLVKHWFFFALAAVILLALCFPQAGIAVNQWHLLRIAIFLSFLITGLTLPSRQITGQLKNLKPVAAAMFSLFVLFPLLAYALVKISFAAREDFLVGVCILAVAPATVASGTILTHLARGNVPLSLLINVTSNTLAIFTIPISLKLLLQFAENIDLPVGQMIRSLTLTVLVPTLLGQIARIWLSRHIPACRKLFSFFSSLVVLLIIFNAFASSAPQITAMGFPIAALFLFVFLLHGLILVLNYTLARFLRLDQPSTAAFTIHASQKTLAVTYIVWSGYFSAFALALIPTIGYHLTQVIFDVFVARRFAATAHPIPAQPAS